LDGFHLPAGILIVCCWLDVQGSFVTTLLSVVVNPQNPIDARRQASLQLKNTFVSRDEAKEQMLQQRWLALEEGVRAPIRDGLLKILADPQQDMRSTAALVRIQQWVAAIILICEQRRADDALLHGSMAVVHL